MAAIDDLKTAWETEIAKISDTLRNANATYQLDRYIAALAKQAALEANEISQYSIGNRSITRRDADAGKVLITDLQTSLYYAVYGNVGLVDMNTDIAEPAGSLT